MRILPAALVIAIAACILGSLACAPQPEPQNPPSASLSAAEQDINSTEAIDWSTVTPESLWEDVAAVYEEQGPRYALSLLEQAVSAGALGSLEADQVRARLLYQLGRLDEAFLALARYKLDADHPELLNLRADVLWAMGRYDEARRDYELLLEAAGDEASPELLGALARLYDELGEWEEARRARERLQSSAPDHPVTFQLRLHRAILSEDVEQIRQVASEWSEWLPEGAPQDPLSMLAEAYSLFLEGSPSEAARGIRRYVTEYDFQADGVNLLLHLDAETDEFGAFEDDLRSLLERLDAIQWLDAPEGLWPQPVDQPLVVAQLLGWASALELGRGDSARADVLAERARALDPYDFVALLELGAVRMCSQDIAGLFELLEEASGLAPPSDVRVRLRQLQLARLRPPGAGIPWEPEAVALELESILRHRMSEYPDNSFFQAARAEILAFEGNLEDAFRESERACSLPGATREMHLRRAYYLARLGRTDEAWEIVKQHLPPSAPHLVWASALVQEAVAQSDANLAAFATMVRTYLDPTGLYPGFFAPAGSN